jgi:hypothetical protein
MSLAAWRGLRLLVAALALLGSPLPSRAAEKAPVGKAAATVKPAGKAAAKPAPPVGSVVRVVSDGAVENVAGIAHPSAVDVSSDGRWLVADKTANRVVVYGPGAGEEKTLPVGLPEDAGFLPAGGFLITSARDKAVIEMDESGKMGVGEYRDLKAPMEADRLPNGHTLIADSRPGRVLEVDRDKKVVWSYAEGILLPWDVELAADGNVLLADYNRHHVLCLRRDGSTCWRINDIGHPSSLQVCEDGSLLVSAHKSGWLLWFDAARHGIGHWKLGRELDDFASTPSMFLVAQKLRDSSPVSTKRRGARARRLARRVNLGAPRITRAIEILRKRPPKQPFFLTIFLMNPHYPYLPHRARFGGKAAGPSNPGPVNAYDAEIFEADEQIGRLLEFLAGSGQMDDTIVVFSTDHGEEMGDHGKRFHGDTLYDCVLNVTMVISGIDRRGHFPGLVREIDVMPTLLDYLGIEVEPPLAAQMAGTSVRRLLEPGVEKTGLVAYSQSRFRDNTHLISERTESRKVIADVEAGSAQIYDLGNDAQEHNDLAQSETSEAELARLTAWESGLQVAKPDAGPAEAVPEEVLERLHAAGYLNDE